MSHPSKNLPTALSNGKRRHPPRYGDLVALADGRYYVVAWIVAPTSALLIRPGGAPDAATDRLVELERLAWNRSLRQWEAAYCSCNPELSLGPEVSPP